MKKADDNASHAISEKKHLEVTYAKDHSEKKTIARSKNRDVSRILQTWLSQTPADEPFNLVGWNFESLRGSRTDESELNDKNSNSDGWSLEVVYGSDNEERSRDSRSPHDGSLDAAAAKKRYE